MSKNKIAILWNYLTLPLAIIGLSGLSDNLIKWHGFLNTLIDNWHIIIFPVWKFLFAWIPFQIPTIIYDYLTFGIIFGSLQIKTLLPSPDKNANYKELINNVLFLAYMFFSFVLFWPYQIYTIFFYRFTGNQSIINQAMREMAKAYFKWTSYVFIGFLILLAINYIILFP